MSTASPLNLTDTDNPLVEGLERLPVHPTSLVIFGATGDLAHRKLLPALYNLAHEGQLPERFEMIGVGRRDQEHEDFRDAVTRVDRALLPAQARPERAQGADRGHAATSRATSTTTPSTRSSLAR